MKGLCKAAHVEAGKVFPHNLWHLFARVYYAVEKDLSKLADLLGHANIATTRVTPWKAATRIYGNWTIWGLW